MKWAIAIEKAINGYICRWYDEDFEGNKIIRSQVFEIHEGENGELEAIENVLCCVKDHFGVYFNKHDKYYLDISVKKNKEFGT